VTESEVNVTLSPIELVMAEAVRDLTTTPNPDVRVPYPSDRPFLKGGLSHLACPKRALVKGHECPNVP